MNLTTMNLKYLDSPCQELSNGGLESVVTLLVRWQIDYSSACRCSAIQLYLGKQPTYNFFISENTFIRNNTF